MQAPEGKALVRPLRWPQALAVLALTLLAASSFASEAAPTPAAVVPLADTTPPANFSMNSEPSFTNGTSNTVSWSAGDDPDNSLPISYEVQASRLLNFSVTEATSGWIQATSWTFTGLQDGILYYYRVRARDAANNTAGFSAPTSSTQDDAPPSTPIIGAEPSFTVSTFNTLSWGASTDAGVAGVQYFAESSTSSTFASVFSSSGWTAGTSSTFFGLTSGTTYYFHVKARDSFFQETPWSAVASSTQDADAPSTPVLVPEPAFTAGTSNTVSWAASTDTGVGGIQYQLQYSTSSTFASGVVSSPWQAGLTFTATPLAGATQYYFRVSARDAFALQSAFSAIVSSTQDTLPPSTPTITAEPAFTNGTSNTAAWSASVDTGVGGIEYWIQQSRSSTFATLEDESGWISATSFTFTKLDDAVTYYYRVKAHDALGQESAFSATTSSTQDNAPPTNPVIAPEPAYTAGASNTISWGAAVDSGVGGVQYLAEMSTSSTFSTVTATVGWTAFTSATFSSLSDGTTYYFRVRARDAFGRESGSSAVTASTQDNSPPSVPVVDAEPAFTQGLSNTVSWQASTDAGSGNVQYWIQYSTSPTFAFGVVTVGPQSPLFHTATPLGNGASYYYRVLANDALGFFSAWSFIVSSTQDNSAPAVPVFAAEPAFTNGTLNTVSWGAAADATSGGVQYAVESSRSAAFTAVEDSSGWITSLSFTFSRLDDAVTFYFRVKARDAVGLESAFSATVSSTQDNAAPTIPLMNPEPSWTQGASNTVSWAASSDSGVGGNTYLAQRSASPVFATIDATVGWTALTSATFGGLTDGTVYYYRVKARDAFLRETAYSTLVSSGQDNAAPSVPVMAAEPAFTVGTDNTVSWSASLDTGVGGVQFQAQRATNAAFTTGVVITALQSGTSFTFAGLVSGQTYFFRARASDALGQTSAFSASTSSAQDGSAPPAPAMAAEPAYTQGSSNALAWGAVVDGGVGGVQYWVESSRQAAFTVVEASSGWLAATSFTFTRLDDGVRFFYHVKSRDAFLQESAFSASVSSVQDASPPPVPVMSAMSAISSGTFQVPIWSAVTDAGVGGVQYFAQYAASATFAVVLGNSGWTTNQFWVVSGLSDGVTYFYHVKARDSLLQESAFSSAVSSRQDNAAPSSPSMVAEPAFTAGTTNTVSWSTSVDAGIGGVVYDLQIATNPSFTGASAVSGLSATSYTASGLGNGTTYFYRVRARDAFGFTTAYSAGTSSTQDNAAPPAPAVAAEPTFTQGTSNTLSWSAVADAGVGGVTYDIQASRSPLFATIEAESGWVAGTSYTFTRLEDGVTYHYRVAARDAFLFQSAFSPVVSSTQDSAAPSVPVVSPEPAFTAGTSNTIAWANGTDAGVGGVTHDLSYANNPSFAGATVVTGVTSPRNVAGLSDAVTFFFRVRAVDALGQASAWSAVEYSTQDAAAPTVPSITPEPGFTPGLGNTVSWSASSDAGVGSIQYWAEYAASATFATVLGNSGWTSSTSATFLGLADGTRFYYRVKARDGFLQESAFSASANSQQDNAAPSTPGTSALAAFSPGSVFTFSWSASSDSGVGGVEYEAQLASSPTFSPLLDSSGWVTSTSFTFAGLSDATTHYFRVRARDAFGNTGAFSTVRSTTMDASAPSVPLLFSEPAFTSGSSNAVSWAVSSDAGVGGIQYQFEYSLTPAFVPALTVTTSWGVTSPYTASGLLDGVAYYFRARARDAFLFTSQWSTAERSTQDASAPSVPVTAGLPPVVDGSMTPYSWFPSADVGVGGVQYQAEVALDPFFAMVVQRSAWLNGTAFGAGPLNDATVYYYHVRARDAFGYTSAWSATDAALTDFRPPPVPSVDPMAAFSKGLSALVTWRAVVDAGVGAVQYQVLAFATTDTTKPFAASPWTADIQQTVGGLPEGALVYFAVQARDGLGHTSPLSGLVSTRPDNSPPPVPSLGALPAFTSGLTLTAAWSDVTDAGVGGVVFRAQISPDPSFQAGVSDSGWVSGLSYTAPGLADGTLYFLRVKARDAFEFESAWSALERTRMDNTPPGVPTPGVLAPYTEGASVTLAWTQALDAGVGGVAYNAQVSTAADFSVVASESGWTPAQSWTFTGLADGVRYHFRVVARDAFFHNSSPSASVSTTMDASAPPAPELLVLSAFTAGLQLSVRWTAVVDLGVGAVEYRLEASTDGTFDTGAVSSGWLTGVSYTLAGLADGESYFVRVQARDVFAHVSAWGQVRNSTMDDSVPRLAVDQSAVTTNVNAVDLTGTAEDGVSGVLDVLYSTDLGATWLTAAGRSNWTAVVPGLIEGETWVLLKARDLVGHESAASRVLVTVDETAPIVAFQAPTNGSVLTGLVGVYAVIADPNFASFRLQAREQGEANFTDIVGNGTVARGDNFLGLWDTRLKANGAYELRLTARDTLDQVTQRTIVVRLLNSDLAVSYNDLTVSDRSPLRGQVVNVTAVVTNFGTAPAEEVTIRVKDNGNVIYERAAVTVGAHASFSVDIPYNITESGAHSFTLEASYPEGTLDTGAQTTTVVVAGEPPVREPEPFLIGAAGLLGLTSLLLIVAIGAWAVVSIQRLKRLGPSAGTFAGQVPEEAVDVEWESEEFL